MRASLAFFTAVWFGACLMWWAASPPAWAASQQTFPNLRADELLRGGAPHDPGGIEALYLYGTLSLLERRADAYRIDVAKTKHRHLLPLATLDIYHDIQTYAQTEFSDYTVWGLLADFMFHEASRIPYDLERSRALRKIQAVQRRHGRRRSPSAYPDALGVALPNGGQNRAPVSPDPRLLSAGALALGMQPAQPLFDLRGDHVFTFEEPVRHHGEQRQFYARSDFHVGRGGRNYHPEGIIGVTLKRILQIVHVLFDHKVLTIAGLGIAVAFIKMTQNMLPRQR